MAGGIYVIQDGGGLIEMTERAYASEELLQKLLAQYPSLLAGDQIDTAVPRRFLLIRREMAVPSEEQGGGRWALDHLFIDQDAVPTLVEVKRSSDSRIRREVIGQMLDYAANAVVYWPTEKLRSDFETRCAADRIDPEECLREHLGAGRDADTFWQTVRTNLRAGRVRLIFIADVIPPELRRIIEFLNQQMDPAEVLGVEIRQYLGPGLKTLVPRVIGLTAEAEQKKAVGRTEIRQWDESSLLAELVKRSPTEAAAARRILSWAQHRTDEVWWGRGKQYGSAVPTIHHKGRAHQLFAVWTTGTVEIYFYWYTFKPPFDSEEKRVELLNQLNAILDVPIPRDAISRKPPIPLASLADDIRLTKFLEIYDWVIDAIRCV